MSEFFIDGGVNAILTKIFFFPPFSNYPSEQSCAIDGELHKESEEFVTGIDECAKCYCADGRVKCNVMKCQELLSHSEHASYERAAPEIIDYANIKNQLAKQYFTDFDPARLKVITNALGCKSADCPQLLSASSIDYNIIALNRQEYVGRADKLNKIGNDFIIFWV